MCATTRRTESVVPRSQHVLRSYFWQNVSPKFFAGGLPWMAKSGYPACETQVGVPGGFAVAPEHDDSNTHAATSTRSVSRTPQFILPKAVISRASVLWVMAAGARAKSETKRTWQLTLVDACVK